MGLSVKQTEPITFFSSGCQIVGEVTGNGRCEIYGKVKGSIKIAGELIIAEGADIEGKIESSIAIILGKVMGDVKGSDSARLGGLSCVRGNIDTLQLTIEKGARYMGAISMRDKEN